MKDDLREELAKLRELIAQTQAMGLDILELEDRVAEIEALLAEEEEAESVAETPSEDDALQILTPDIQTGDWENRPVTLIGGTANLLPEHRAALMDACMENGLFPIVIEQLPTDPIEAVRSVLTVVNNVHLYIGIFAFRYGRIPKGAEMSIPEIEYSRVAELDIPRLVFFMDKKHPITPDYIDRGKPAARLADLKARLRRENEVETFVSPEDLQTKAAAKLSRLSEQSQK